MATDAPNDDEVEKIQQILVHWRQGDFVLLDQAIIHLAAPNRNLMEGEAEGSGEAPGVVAETARGLAVITQTCDIVRSPLIRPFVQVAPLVEVESSELKVIARGYRPAYLYIPNAAPHCLVADLDRIVTVEKALFVTWKRLDGWEDEQDGRRIGRALSRKFSRPAFPDDFVGIVRDFQARLTKKHDRKSPEGTALRAIREIRVRAAPSWSAPEVELTFTFIEDDDAQAQDTAHLLSEIEDWMSLIPTTGRFVSIDFDLTTLDDMTGRDYVESDQLDLDHLSSRSIP